MVSGPKKPIRVRIAPSPTGNLHVGTARTALFNWLFTKKHGGDFILRIEDTDLERSHPKYEQDIIEGLEWLDLKWDEGPYRQSERLDSYEKYINKLLDENLAYYCFCTQEELEAERQAQMAQGLAPKYSGKCRALLNRSKTKKRLKAGEGHIIRFKTPEARIQFTDIIRGKVSFDMSLTGDFSIAKDPRVPLYNFAVVVDDYEMEISHVIRGEDHIPNTPRQIALQSALGFPQPKYAHLPLILDPNRSKMSKRYSATSIAEYKNAGYLPEAMINFLALLGWHPAPEQSTAVPEQSSVHGEAVRGRPSEREIFSIEELAELFDLKRVQKAGAVFNQEKLDWLNAQYIRRLSEEVLMEKITALTPLPKTLARDQILKAISLVKERMHRLTDFTAESDFFFELPEYAVDLLIWKDSPPQKIKNNLEEALQILSAVGSEEFTKENLERTLMPFAEKAGRGEVLWPIRVALSGRKASPGPFEIMEVLGKQETLRRIKHALEKF